MRFALLHSRELLSPLALLLEGASNTLLQGGLVHFRECASHPQLVRDTAPTNAGEWIASPTLIPSRSTAPPFISSMALPGDFEVTGSPDRGGRDEKIWKITPL